MIRAHKIELYPSLDQKLYLIQAMGAKHHLLQMQGGGEFRRQLNYKAEQRGCRISVIGRFYPSSKTCSCCGHIKSDLTLRDRVYNCDNCGSSMDRDVNAALNILKEGTDVSPSIIPTGPDCVRQSIMECDNRYESVDKSMRAA